MLARANRRRLSLGADVELSDGRYLSLKKRAMKLYDLLQFSVCMFSVLAAGFWLRSATTTLPNLTENLKWDGTGPFPDALKSQSRWSAAGAACAGMAAFSQSLAAVLPYLQSN
jgi:hypothetical protein